MRLSSIGALALLATGMAAGQEAAPTRATATYRLQFTLHESESGKRVSAKNYAILVTPNGTGKLNASTRLPVPSGAPNPAGTTQYTFIDTGMGITCRLQERDGHLLLDTEVRFTMPPAENEGKALPPATQQFSSQIVAFVSPGKPATIVDFDDLPTRRHFAIEVTAAKLP